MSTSNGASRAENQLEFGDDFDVSLSGLCLGSAAVLNSNNLFLINQLFGLSGENDLSLNEMACITPNCPAQPENNHRNHDQINRPPNGSLTDTSSSPVMEDCKSHGLACSSSPLICPIPPAPTTSSHSQHHHHVTTHPAAAALPPPPPPSASVPLQQHHHHVDLSAISVTSNPVQYNPNEVFYSIHSDQAISYSTDLPFRPKPSALMPTLLEQQQDNNPSSKRIRFKCTQQLQQQQPASKQEDSQQAQLSETSSTSDGNFHSDQKNYSEATSDSIYNPLNVANCYSYTWRRWSKTDAPSVKNRDGTVQVPHTMVRIDEVNRKFQYILGAPTSVGTRTGLMTMTYLNQSQSYEIRLKKLKKVSHEPNLKSCVRIGFVEKRLHYREEEELNDWLSLHKDRIIDIDFSMSYGVFDVNLQSLFNHISFVWNPGREASIFIKINCISTEFTSKRHGGERGTPLRLIVDTFSLDGTKLDSACCLIKVFKSKGAERKHKTDRDRVLKNSPDLYLPSYDCTLLVTYNEGQDNQKSNESLEVSPKDSENSNSVSSKACFSRIRNIDNSCQESDKLEDSNIQPLLDNSTPISPSTSVVEANHFITSAPSTPSSLQLPQSTSAEDLSPGSQSISMSMLSASAGAIETYEWLKKNRFFRLAEQLCEYTAEDLRRLSRNDLIQLCDLKDGIRLFNLIHSDETTLTKLTIFVTVDGNEHCALYFRNLTTEEMRDKLIESLQEYSLFRIRHMHLIGPNGIRIRLTNNVIQNMKNESIYTCSLIKVDNEHDLVLRLNTQ